MSLPDTATSSARGALVTIATFPNPYEAELAHVALDSAGISAVVHNDHGQYLSAAPWVHLQVAPGDRALATNVLDQGPLHGHPGSGETEATASGAATDDLAPLRAERRILIARWFLCAGAVKFSLSGFLLPVSVAVLALAAWSNREARRALGIACGLQSIVVFVSVSTLGFAGLSEVIPLLAYYYGWASAVPEHPTSFLASPYANLRVIDIGDAWRVDEPRDVPGAWPTWAFRDLGWFLVAVAVVLGLKAALRVA